MKKKLRRALLGNDDLAHFKCIRLKVCHEECRDQKSEPMT